MIATLILVVHWSLVVSLSVRVIMRRPPVGYALAWLAIIFGVPFVGVAVYLLFGERRLGAKRAARVKKHYDSLQGWQSELRKTFPTQSTQIDSDAVPLMRHAEQVLGFSALPGNQIDLLADYETIFDAMIVDIDNAQHSCHLCFYIWQQGGRVDEIIEALVRASARGVECLAMSDGLGSKSFLRSKDARRLKDAGIRFTVALPTGLLRAIFIRQDLRNHRKIVVIDNHIAYAGSQNLVDPRFFKQDSGVGEWVDAVLRITGPAAAALNGVFLFDWSLETDQSYNAPSIPSNASDLTSETTIQVVPSGQDLFPDAIHQLLLTAIYSAKNKLVMTTPYFVPDESLLTALISAALSGVNVTLIVPARNDSLLVRYASVAHFDDLLRAGVKIALFNGGLLHTKSMTIDDEISIFGSVNLDMRSLYLNFEISLFLYNAAFTKRLDALQNEYLLNSTDLDAEPWKQRPKLQQFAENTFRLIGPLL